MQEYVEYVQKGFRILHPLLAGFVGAEMCSVYKDEWWNEILCILSYHQDELPSSGEYAELVDSLDIANCLRVIKRKWDDVFQYSFEKEKNAQTWAKELMGIRNTIAHIGQQDLPQLDAERYLDTMARFCEKIDEEGAQQLRELYNEARNSESETASLSGPMPIEETLVDDTDMREGAVEDLMTLIRTNKIYKTKLTKKVTFAGKAELYPVYRVRLDALYFGHARLGFI